MEFELAFRSQNHQTGQGSTYIYEILVAGAYYRAVQVTVSDIAIFLIGKRLGLEDPWLSPESREFQRGLHRYATHSIEDALRAGTIEPATNNEFYHIKLSEDDEAADVLTQLGRGDKTCSYQRQEDRELYCSAASTNDRTALPIITSDGRRLAPTSRPLCAACALPDTDYICSHFLHPQIVGMSEAASDEPMMCGLDPRIREWSIVAATCPPAPRPLASPTRPP